MPSFPYIFELSFLILNISQAVLYFTFFRVIVGVEIALAGNVVVN